MGSKFLLRFVPMLAKKSLKRSGLRSKSEVLVHLEGRRFFSIFHISEGFCQFSLISFV